MPTMEDIPEELRGMSSSDQELLALFVIDVGRYVRRQHGYRVKTGGITLRTKPDSVVDRVNAVACNNRRRALKLQYVISL